MANLFANLPVPVADGVGASVDVSLLGAEKTVVVGGTFTAQIHIEVSDDNTNFAPVWTFEGPDFHTVTVPCGWMRVRQSSFAGGTAVASVGSNDYGTLVAALAAPAVTGTGAPTDVSAHGFSKAVIVSGTYSGNIIIEGSEDGVVYGPILSFANADIQYINSYAQFMRVRRSGVVGGATPDVYVASGNDAPGPGSGGGCSAILGFGNSEIDLIEPVFLDPWFGGRALTAGQVEMDMVAPRAGFLQNLFVRHNATDGSDTVVTYTVLLNGVATALTTIVGTAAIGQTSDLVNTVAVVAGDRIAMTADPAVALSTGVLEIFATMEFTCTETPR